MAYGDYNGPDKPDKGHEGGSCNRQRCQASPTRWYNHGSHGWYCDACARDIGQDTFNQRDWQLRYQPSLGHPMFETREQMGAREANKPEIRVAEMIFVRDEGNDPRLYRRQHFEKTQHTHPTSPRKGR